MRLLHDPDLLSDTIGSIYDCVLDPGRWEGVLADVGALIGARRAYLGVATAAGESRGRAFLHGYPPQEEAFRHAAINPLLPIGLVHPLDRAFVASRDYGLPALRASRFYREALAPAGDLDAAAFVMIREGDAFAHWIMVTQDDRGPITEEEAAGLELIAPHMRRAVEISNVLGLQRLSAGTYRDALAQLDAAVLILDGACRLTYANPRAEAELEGGSLLRLLDGRVAGASEGARQALRRIAAGSLVGGAGGFEAALQGTDGAERLLFAVALDPADGMAEPASRAVMLVLRAPREDTRNPVAIAARVFDLTPAQVAVLAFLAQGHPPDEIARILGISTTTVRSHLADLFRRTGTSRQAELVARALSLASPLAPSSG
jgi:DNA-binding CsgD family transcriptional regulator